MFYRFIRWTSLEQNRGLDLCCTTNGRTVISGVNWCHPQRECWIKPTTLFDASKYLIERIDAAERETRGGQFCARTRKKNNERERQRDEIHRRSYPGRMKSDLGRKMFLASWVWGFVVGECDCRRGMLSVLSARLYYIIALAKSGARQNKRKDARRIWGWQQLYNPVRQIGCR